MHNASVETLLLPGFSLLFLMGSCWMVIKSGILRKTVIGGTWGLPLNCQIEERLYLDPKRQVIKITDGLFRYTLLLGTSETLLHKMPLNPPQEGE